MNYIYDILINFNYELFDFYDWNKDDNIIHIRKIPIFKINKEEFIDFLKYKIQLNKKFLKKIENKTEVFQKNGVKNLDYSVLLTTNEDIIALKLNNCGKIIGYSKLLIDEQIEVLDYIKMMKEIELEYKILEKININNKTRKEIKYKQYIEKEIEKILKERNYEKLKYLYLECFNKNKEISYIIKNIYNEIDDKWEQVYLKLYNFFQVTI